MTDVIEQGLPQSVTAEQCCLGAALVSLTATDILLSALSKADFYGIGHQHVYQAISDLRTRDVTPDPMTVGDELGRTGKLDAIGGLSYLFTLTQTVPSASLIDHYAGIVRDRSVSRRLIDVCESTMRGARGGELSRDLLERLDLSVQTLTERTSNERLQPIAEAVTAQFEAAEAAAQRVDGLSGVPTGFAALDWKTGGWQPGNLVILAARPSMGKTAMCLSLAATASQKGTVALFSLEMNKDEVAQRLICADAELDSRTLRAGRFIEDEAERFGRAIGYTSELPIEILDKPDISVTEIRAELRRSKKQYALIAIDYLQLIRAPAGANLNEKVTEISRQLKSLARELNVPVICLSQLSRAVEKRTDKRPLLSDLRDSGSIEQDADLVLFIHRQGYYERQDEQSQRQSEQATLIVEKHRNGATGEIPVTFKPWCAKFEDLA